MSFGGQTEMRGCNSGGGTRAIAQFSRALVRRPLFYLVPCVAAQIACGFVTRSEVAPDPAHPVLAIGSSAPDFALPGVDGRIHRLSDYSASNVIAVVFTCNHCLASQLYEGRIGKLFREYRDRSVALVTVNPDNANQVRMGELAWTDVDDSLAGMKDRAAYRHLDYPYLYDGETQSLTSKFGVVATPQIFVFDRGRKLRYEGRIDDNPREPLARTHDARNAIDALLSGRPVAVSQTQVAGCPTNWLSKGSGRDAEMAKIEAEPVRLEMATPEVLKKLRWNGSGKLALVNFWATWCGPCVGEFPDLQDTYRMYRNRGFDLVTVSSNLPDEKAAVLEFLRKKHASSRNLLFATTDTYGLQDAFDPNMGGAVPFTLLLAPNGDVLYQEQGELGISRMRRAILANLPDDAEHRGSQAYWSGN